MNLLVKNGDQTICCRYFKFRNFNGNLNMAFQVRHSIRSPSAEFRLCVLSSECVFNTGFEVTLRRHIGKYVVYNHMPSGLFVCVSWISFVVPIEAIPGRMSLLITLLLVLINIFNSSVFTEPLSHGITAVSGKTYPHLYIQIH